MKPIKNLKIEADDDNSIWNDQIQFDTFTLEDPWIKQMELDKKQCWAIYFAPKKSFWRGSVMLGGSAFVFIDKSDGSVIWISLEE